MKEYSISNLPGCRNSLPGGARIAGKGASNSWGPAVPDRSVEEESIEQITSTGQQLTCESMSPQESNFQRNVGFTGLHNLGNTCFMNCVLQALANIRVLRDYFLSQGFLQDLNEENPLGTGGRLARSFYTTLKHLWSGEQTAYDPVRLRNIVAKKAPQFLGIMQQDAQEFMSFFLDALHEDLNRVRNKPVFELGDYDGYPDEEVAEISWKLYKSRNDSFIIDKFHGMYKSRLVCPVCKKESITFDPFLFLSVPLPKPTKCVSVLFFPLEERKNLQIINVRISEEASLVSDILNYFVKTYCIKAENLRMFQAEGGRLIKSFSSSSFLPYLTSSESLVVCEMSHDNSTSCEIILMQSKETPKAINNCAKCGKCAEKTGVKIRRCTKCKSVGYCDQDCQKSDWPQHKLKCNQRKFIGYPVRMNIGRSIETYKDVFDAVFSKAKHSVNIHNAEQTESLSKFDGLKKNLEESEKAAIACAYVGEPTHLKHDSLFNIYFCRDNDLASMTLVQDRDNEKIDLAGVTHIIVEWKAETNVVEKKLHLGHKSNRQSNPTLHDCIQLFTEPEVLAREEAWYCPRCKSHQEATKELSLWKLPDVLVIQLKRFSFRNRLWRDKIDKHVTFPIKGLDMSPFCIRQQSEPLIYDLFGVVNHHGSLFGGHYTSYVQLMDENGGDSDFGWRLCDDSHVTSVRSEKEVVTRSSYVMFYHRRKQSSLLNNDPCLWQNNELDDQFNDPNPTNLPNDFDIAHTSNQIAKESISIVKENAKLKIIQTGNGNRIPPTPEITGQESGDNASLEQKTEQNAEKRKEKVSINKLSKFELCSSRNKESLAPVFPKTDTEKLIEEKETPLPYTDMDAMD